MVDVFVRWEEPGEKVAWETPRELTIEPGTLKLWMFKPAGLTWMWCKTPDFWWIMVQCGEQASTNLAK